MMGVDLDYLFLGCALGVLGEGGAIERKEERKRPQLMLTLERLVTFRPPCYEKNVVSKATPETVSVGAA